MKRIVLGLMLLPSSNHCGKDYNSPIIARFIAVQKLLDLSIEKRDPIEKKDVKKCIHDAKPQAPYLSEAIVTLTKDTKEGNLVYENGSIKG